MAEIEILLPTVQYGNVKVRATPEELGLESLTDAYDVGVASAVYLNVFTQGFKKGATLDVAAPQSPGVEEATKLLDEGLGGVTEVPADDSVSLEEGMRLASEAGKRDADAAPWDSTAKVDKPKKPWENEEW